MELETMMNLEYDRSEKDMPVEQAMKAATRILQEETVDTVWQEWSCQACGHRQTMEHPNIFYRSGICEDCGKTSPIEKTGYVVLIVNGPKE